MEIVIQYQKMRTPSPIQAKVSSLLSYTILPKNATKSGDHIANTVRRGSKAPTKSVVLPYEITLFSNAFSFQFLIHFVWPSYEITLFSNKAYRYCNNSYVWPSYEITLFSNCAFAICAWRHEHIYVTTFLSM